MARGPRGSQAVYYTKASVPVLGETPIVVQTGRLRPREKGQLPNTGPVVAKPGPSLGRRPLAAPHSWPGLSGVQPGQ